MSSNKESEQTLQSEENSQMFVELKSIEVMAWDKSGKEPCLDVNTEYIYHRLSCAGRQLIHSRTRPNICNALHKPVKIDSRRKGRSVHYPNYSKLWMYLC